MFYGGTFHKTFFGLTSCWYADMYKSNKTSIMELKTNMSIINKNI